MAGVRGCRSRLKKKFSRAKLKSATPSKLAEVDVMGVLSEFL